MPYVSLDRGELYYHASGAGDPLILVPGLGGSAESFARLLPLLSAHFFCLTYDHMGTGRSTRRRGDCSVDHMADDLLALMERLGIGRAHVMGHSTGGAIAQTIAVRQPEKLRRMILLASWARADAHFRWIFAMRKAALTQIGVEAYLHGTAFFLYPPWWINAHEATIRHGIVNSVADRPDPQILADRIDAILAFDRTADLGRLRLPTLVMGARNDALVPPHNLETLARMIPQAELDILPDGGHVPHQTLPEEIASRVLRFLDADVAPAAAAL